MPVLVLVVAPLLVVVVVRFSDLPYVALPTGATTLAGRFFSRSLAVAVIKLQYFFVVGRSDVVFINRPCSCTCHDTGGRCDFNNALSLNSA